MARSVLYKAHQHPLDSGRTGFDLTVLDPRNPPESQMYLRSWKRPHASESRSSSVAASESRSSSVAGHRNGHSNVPSSTPGHSNSHKRHRSRRRNNPSSQPSVVDTANISENGNQHKRTQTNADSDRPTKRARKAASTSTPDDGAVVPDQSAAGRLDRRQPTVPVPAGSRASVSSARPGSNDSEVDGNANRRTEFPYVSFNGGMGGAGGSGGKRSGNGGNAMGPVFNVKNMHFHF
ncbi:hypothetical protein MSAN_01828500 [Mycena sanguinolenta]|uniref:Uncharacterized protein n=1 Tax=Mycena sanguinolenta TaxID=230812 RepID=A0A8H6XTB0_9AGAR|nr:hypothetical protein MSAN_01828500 [Mycena sanguinolenta]